MSRLSGSVGAGATNNRHDVALVQKQLNSLVGIVSGLELISVDHLVGTDTISAIKSFQRTVPNVHRIDGLIRPSGPTARALFHDESAPLAENISAPLFRSPELLNSYYLGTQMPAIMTERFISLVSNGASVNSSFGKLTSNKEEGLRFLIGKVVCDSRINDIRQAAYFLATIKHETAHTWRPIEESEGSYRGRPYADPMEITLDNGQSASRTYIGRGYVQITWKKNYESLGKKVGLGNQLAQNPELALLPNTAYEIAVLGMKDGLFTGKKLSSYIAGVQCDYLNARRIINGTDQAIRIKRYAIVLEHFLRLSAV